jgi:hypothetical protein
LGYADRHAVDAAYFRCARNFLRQRWLLVWLTGASPAADESFNSVVRQQVQTVKACCRGCKAFIDEHEQHATSLRVSRYGYADTAFSDMPVSFNSLAEYRHDIRALMATPSEKFQKLGLMANGLPSQINDRVLQSESEFYAAIRLKGRLRPGEGHLDAMEREGVHYAEVRILDLNPFAPEAIDLETLRFIQVLMLDCWARIPRSTPTSGRSCRRITTGWPSPAATRVCPCARMQAEPACRIWPGRCCSACSHWHNAWTPDRVERTLRTPWASRWIGWPTLRLWPPRGSGRPCRPSASATSRTARGFWPSRRDAPPCPSDHGLRHGNPASIKYLPEN